MCCSGLLYALYIVRVTVLHAVFITIISLACVQNCLYNDASPQIQQIYSSTITISKTVYDTDASGNDDVTRFRSISPYSSQYNSLSYSQTSPYSSLRRSQPSPHNTLQRIEVNPYSADDYRQPRTAVSPSLVSVAPPAPNSSSLLCARQACRFKHTARPVFGLRRGTI